MEKTSKKLPCWIKTGFLIFPVITIIGIILRIAGGDNVLFVGAIVPSVIYEEIFERCCALIADNEILNLLFIITFWFAIGAGIGLIIEKIQTRPRLRRGSN
ncbi:hypothetical protein ACFL3C_02365 [Patescibacteria group bacterium]